MLVMSVPRSVILAPENDEFRKVDWMSKLSFFRTDPSTANFKGKYFLLNKTQRQATSQRIPLRGKQQGVIGLHPRPLFYMNNP